MSKVSVIVPIFNPGNKLKKCIKSIIHQTFKDFELILVNDGSTDNSLAICKNYEKQDNRIIVINKKNEGSIEARRKGVKRSKSEYIMFVDADDWIDKCCLEKLYSEVINNLVDISVCKHYKVLGNSGLIKREYSSNYFDGDKVYNKEEIKNILVVAYFHGHPFPSSLYAKLYKRDLLLKSGKFLHKIRFLGDDLYYNLEMLLKVNKISVIDSPLYYYRVGGGTSKYMPHLFQDIINGYQIQKRVIDEYFPGSTHINGVSIMLLNTLRTSFCNLFKSNVKDSVIKEKIGEYILDQNILEAIENEGVIRFFSNKYLNAIRCADVDYLFNLGQKDYKVTKIKRIINNITSL